MTVRASAVSALSTLLSDAYAWASPVSTRLRLIYDIPKAERPACFIFEGGIEKYEWSNGAVPRRIMPIRIYIYTASSDQSVSDAVVQDGILDAIDSAMAVSGSDSMVGRNTLGGTVYNCQIKGGVLRVPGDLDGDGMLVIPIALTLP